MSVFKCKNAKYQGIDISRKFIVIRDNFGGIANKGDILTISRDDDSKCPYFINERTGEMVCFFWDWLAYADTEKTWENLEVGDVITTRSGDKTVLGICGSLLFLSYTNDKTRPDGGPWTISRVMRQRDWKIKDTTPEDTTPEYTMEEAVKKMGHSFKIKK